MEFPVNNETGLTSTAHALGRTLHELYDTEKGPYIPLTDSSNYLNINDLRNGFAQAK